MTDYHCQSFRRKPRTNHLQIVHSGRAGRRQYIPRVRERRQHSRPLRIGRCSWSVLTGFARDSRKIWRGGQWQEFMPLVRFRQYSGSTPFFR